VADAAKMKLEIGGGAQKASRSRDLLYRLSRLWAWLFLGAMIAFFVIAVPVYNGGAVNFLSVRN